jgi:hypothetical protein
MIQIWESLQGFARKIGRRVAGRIFGLTPPPAWQSVKSSFIGAIIWWEDVRGKGMMAIYFFPRARHSGRTYIYYNVDERIFRLILSAGSHGEEFWRILRNPGKPGSAIQCREITGSP